jgi:hypothetical protein
MVLDGESLLKTYAAFVLLPVAVTLGILVVSARICGHVGGQLIF